MAKTRQQEPLKVGDVVKNQTTRENGEIVRVVAESDLHCSEARRKYSNDTAYVVLLKSIESLNRKEALWREPDIEKVSHD